MRHHAIMPPQEVSRVYCTAGRYDPRKSEARRAELKAQHPISEPHNCRDRKNLIDSFFNLFKKG